MHGGLAGRRRNRRQPGAMRERNPPRLAGPGPRDAADRPAPGLPARAARQPPLPRRPGTAGGSAAVVVASRAPASRSARGGAARPPSASLSVAVLPFDDLGGEARQARFADAFTEDLITELARTDGLRVIARNSVEVYADKAADVREIGRELGRHPCARGQPRAAAGPHPRHGAAHRRRHRRACLVRALRPARGRSLRRARPGADPARRHPDRLRRAALARLDRGGEAAPAGGI